MPPGGEARLVLLMRQCPVASSSESASRSARAPGLGALGPALKRGEPRIARVGRLASALAIKRLQGPGVSLLTPRRQVRRVQAFAAQQRADLTRPRARLGLPQDPQLVLRREPPPLRTLDQFGIRDPPPSARRADTRAIAC